MKATGGAGSGGTSGTASGKGGGAGTRMVDPGPPVPPAHTVGSWVEISPPDTVTDPGGLHSAIGVGSSPQAPATIYVDAYPTWPPSGDKAGIYKSTDRGDTWTGPLGKSFFNNDGSAYTEGNPWQQGVSWNIAVDPTDADTVYSMCSFFGPQGLWKTTDGGDTWSAIMSRDDTDKMSADIYAITIDPNNHEHVLVTFHSGWNFGPDAGVAETVNGGMSWIQHPPQSGWLAGHYAFFLGQDDAGKPSSDAWMLATQGDGYWRTLDAGKTWTQVSSKYQMQHGACALYRASTGVLYMGALNNLLRSTDNGKTWDTAGAPSNQDGYNSVIGDGVRMYVQSANTGTSSVGPGSFYTSLETDGLNWEVQNDQTFEDGPGWMTADRTQKVVYAALWDHGLWRLYTGN